MAPDIYTRIVAAKRYIDNHFHEHISLNHISREACFSRFHFHRLFTGIYQKTPHQYLTSKRIELAGRLLANKALPVGDICNAVGFESIGSFSGLFKKETGFAPKVYRQRAIRRRNETQKRPLQFIPGCFAERFCGDNSNN